MLVLKMYDSLEYARSRLRNTIVREEEGQPVIVSELTGRSTSIKVISINMITDVVKEDRLSNLNLTPVPLGYVNTDISCTHASRMPMQRDWKQGLRRANTVYTNNDVEVSNRQLGLTISGQYPDVRNCIQEVTDRNVRSMAFSRNFCVSRGLNLQYKGRFLIGKMLNEDNFSLLDDFEWCREELMKDLQHD